MVIRDIRQLRTMELGDDKLLSLCCFVSRQFVVVYGRRATYISISIRGGSFNNWIRGGRWATYSMTLSYGPNVEKGESLLALEELKAWNLSYS